MNLRNWSLMKWLLPVAVLAAGIALLSLSDWWLPASRQWLAHLEAAPLNQSKVPTHGEHQADADHGPASCTEDHEHDDHEENARAEHAVAGHDEAACGHSQCNHDHPSARPDDHAHDEANSLQLSRQATATMGLDLRRVELSPFARTVSIPAAVIQRPGTSQVQVTATFTGVITRIHHVHGEAVEPGAPLFDLRLTHEELVEAQSDFLQTAEQLDVAQREVDRLNKIAESGVIAGKSYLEREYEKQKLEALLRSQRQRLLLHGLPEKRIDEILATRRLLQQLTVTAPLPPGGEQAQPRLLEIQALKVEQGQHVSAGDTLCVLSDHAVLYAQGKAFEADSSKLAAAAQEGWPVTAVFEANDNRRQMVEGLKILYLANEVDAESRAFHFYVPLPNERVRDHRSEGGQRFIDWRFRPGQRARLLVPLEPATPQIVLPVEAVVQDGPESYVFEYNQGHFDRRSVHVQYRDQDRVVLANDGILKPGTQVAISGAYQLQLAAKNKTAAPLDPHAGHNH